ncbi:hypothetical protein CHARACLAT_018855 [Characodon lateralis]|uniref:Uncharacterized protein n=1 Tax=Characodon lateralis TaxID=208331 RepID=A0ABU7D8T1_9TELE|nr:hypothetical protein [Characodon lateralis]
MFGNKFSSQLQLQSGSPPALHEQHVGVSHKPYFNTLKFITVIREDLRTCKGYESFWKGKFTGISKISFICPTQIHRNDRLTFETRNLDQSLFAAYHEKR